ncbi:hypothetical protein [Bradyrhizobium sp. S3.2.12]|uniref:hypothetical protein n=1 Tax=Bradyrhizobium sp. S3.2.12 TaxID=3156387 RepID=UPI003396AE99
MTIFKYTYAMPQQKRKPPPPQRTQQPAANAITADAATLRALITGETEATSTIPEYGYNRPHRVRNITFVDDCGDVWTESVVTGWKVPKNCEAGFWATKRINDAILTHHADTGDRHSKFYVNDDTGRIAHGYFESNVEPEDIDYLFAKIGARWGLVGELARYHPEADALDLSTYGSTDSPMPAFGDQPWCIGLYRGFYDEAPVDYLRFAAGEQLPQPFAAFWHARRDVHRRVVKEAKPTNFLIYDVKKTAEGPMGIYRMSGEFPFTYEKVAEAHADDGKGGSYERVAHGSFFDEGPSPELLAFVDCRLAARGQWMVLVPHEDEFVSPAVADLMAGVTRSET